MNNIGWFFPIIVVAIIGFVTLFSLIDKWTTAKGSYEKWLEIELKKNPEYINWLKYANNGKDYKLGKKILAGIRRGAFCVS